MEQAGIPLRQVVNSENHRPWKRPTDPEGLWERALADPPRYVDFVIAFDGDVVDQSVNRSNLTELTEIHATGQPHARIYAARHCPESIALTLPGKPTQKAPDGGDRIRSGVPRPRFWRAGVVEAGRCYEPNPSNHRTAAQRTGRGAEFDAGALAAGGRARRHHRPGTATAAQAGGAAHEYVHLFRRGHVHGSVAATLGLGDGLHADRRRRSFRASASSARARFCMRRRR